MKKGRNNGFLSKSVVSLVALLLVCAMVIGLMPSDTLAAASDADTSGTYSASLGDNASTEFAGRIWTDKSVYTDDVSFGLYGGGNTTIEKSDEEDFLVAFSALGTSQAISGKSVTPLDVVFIIDMSSSMVNNRMDNGRTRLANATVALNDSVETLLALNDYVRVGVVAFNGTSYEVLPLDHYEKYNGRDFFTCSGSTITYNAKSESTTFNNQTISTRSGTNVQKGVFTGMDMLASESETKTTINGKEIQRIPAVIMLTDGEPSNASSYQSWWDIEADTSYKSPSSGGNVASFGMRAIMTASYMKVAINRNYGLSGTNSVKVYSIGVGITDLSSSMRNLAYATIDPANNLSKNNTYSNAMRTAWETYANGGNPTVNSYQFTHPTSNDIVPADKSISALYYVDKYYDADNAESVNDVFSSVVSNISIAAAEVPTEIRGGDPVTSGYITYTDPLGEYTEVKDVKAILYAGNKYTAKSVATSGAETTYVFSAEIHSAVYGDQNLDDIIITVTADANGNETIQIKVPASVIPVRVNTVALNAEGAVDTHTNNGTYPIRVIYSVAVKDEVLKVVDGVQIVDTEKVAAEYIENHKNADGSVDFYSNLYTGTNVVNGNTVGNTTVEFEPSHSNPFYYIQEDLPIYNLNGTQVTVAEGLEDDQEYHYETTFYHGTHVDGKEVVRTGAQLKRTDIIEKDGYLYRAAGSPRLNRILEFEGTKSVNETNTAADFYAPTFEYATGSENAYDGKYVIYLGNNGVVSKMIGGDLEISKNVSAAEGLTAPEATFEFTVDFNGSETLAGTFEYDVVDSTNAIVLSGTISDGGTITLKDGETATIKNLPPATTYKVTEKAVAGFVASVNDVVTNEAAGTIQAGATSSAAYMNRYEVEEVVMPAIGGTKVLEGRVWENGTDSFTFLISPYNDAPLPQGYDAAKGLTVTTAVKDGSIYKADFEFGTIAFEKPGVYRYIISEKAPESAEYLPGMTYSAALYRLVVIVEDNGNGTLKVASTDLQKLYTDDATALFTYDAANNIILNAGEEGQDEVVFVNTYSVDDVVGVPTARKEYTDHSGNKPLVSGMFQFELSAVGVWNGTSVVDGTKDQVPMPVDALGNRMETQITENEGHNVTFGQITFSNDDIPAGETSITFRYQMKEILPAEADAANQYTVNGMKYDPIVYDLDVILSLDAGSDALIVEVKSPSGATPVFRNEYTPEPVKASIEGTKTFTGRDMLSGESFVFNLTPSASTGLATVNGVIDISAAKDTVEVTGGKNGIAKAFDFGEFTFKQPGTYVFYVSEEVGTAGGVTYDEHVTEVTITVTDVNGQLQAEVAYSDGASGAVFENRYDSVFDPSTSVDLMGNKVLTGQNLEEGEFFFVVEELNDKGEVVASKLVPNDAAGSITFLKDVTYDKAGTYVYRIYEDIPTPGIKGMSYDTTKYIFTVTVIDDLAGNLKAYLNGDWLKNEATDEFVTEIKFTNAYVPEPEVIQIHTMHKVIAGDRNKALEANEFQFVMNLESASAADGILLPGETTADFAKNLADRKVQVGNAADGSIQFGSLTFLKAGSYTVVYKEVIPADADKLEGVIYTTEEKWITYKVTDDSAGNLTVTIDGTTGAHTFTNVYETEGEFDLTIEKEFTGRTGNEWLATDAFQFEVVVLDPATQQAIEEGKLIFPKDGTDHIQTLEIAAADADKKVTSPKITVKAPGTYKFVVREVTGTIPGVHYDSTAHEIVVTATDNADGTLTILWDDTATAAADTQIVFKNVYDADATELSGHDNLWVNKNFVGRENDLWLDEDKFTFALKAGDATTEAAIAASVVEMPSATLEVTNANKAHAHFGNIIFHEQGTYTFTVTEVIPDGAVMVDGKPVHEGIVYDAQPRTVIVNVADNGHGELVASVAAESDELTFTNSYSTTPYTLSGDTNLLINKTLTGRKWAAGDSFSFVLKADGGDVEDAIAAGDVVMPASNEITIQKNNDTDTMAGAFGDITFKKAGVYTFTINEVIPAPGAQGMSYDAHELEVTVTVVDNNKGQLEATVTYVGSNTFINDYTPDAAEVDLSGTKELVGRPLSDGEFHFRIYGKSSTVKDALGKDLIPMPENVTVKNGHGGNVNVVFFSNITYTAAGTYVYEIEEVQNNVAGVLYDTEKVTATVTVTYNEGSGKFETAVSYVKGTGSASNSFVFNNSYSTEKTDPVTINAEKSITQINGSHYVLKADAFKFDIKPDPNNPSGDPVAAATKGNAEDGTVSLLSGVQYTKEGEYIYTVTEQLGSEKGMTYDGSTYTIKVNVKEDYKTAKMYAEVTISKTVNGSTEVVDAIVFNNRYQPEFDPDAAIDLTAKKVLVGMDLAKDDFTFTVEELDANDLTKVISSKEVTNEADGSIAILTDVTYEAEGTYVYHFAEKLPDPLVNGMSYDSNVYTYTVTVEDDGLGTLRVTKTELKNNKDTVVSEAVFRNIYAPDATLIDLPLMTKVIDGERSQALQAGEFTFELTIENAADNAGILLPGETAADVTKPERKVQVTNDAEGNIDFGTLTFTKGGDYTVVVKEVQGTADGITYSNEVKRITYRVIDDFAGNLTVGIFERTDNLTFTNIYGTAGVFDLTIAKEFTGRDNNEWLPADQFKFEVVVLDPATQQAIKDGDLIFPVDGTDHIHTLEINAADADKIVTSPKITVNAPGIYKFVVREVTGTIPGVNYDSTPHEIVVTATDNSDGTLTILWDDMATAATDTQIVFKNVYDAKSTELSGHDQLKITKEFTGRENNEWLDSDSFTFKLTAGDAATAEAITEGHVELSSTELVVTNANKAYPHFGNIIFHEEGTYTFTITEVAPAEATTNKDGSKTYQGITYDVTPRTVVVNVVDNDMGELVATRIDANPLIFVNTYSLNEFVLSGKENLEISKTLVGRDWFDGDSFTFELIANTQDTLTAVEAGNVVLPVQTLTIQKNGDAATVKGTFGDIVFKKVGTYEFAIREVIPAEKADGITYDEHMERVVVSVVDNEKGQLVAHSVTFIGENEFINQYVPNPIQIVVSGQKNLIGLPLKAGDFSFVMTPVSSTLKDENGKDVIPMPAMDTVTNGDAEDASKIAFGAISYANSGTYEYKIAEVKGSIPGVAYDAEEVAVTVVVTNNEAKGILEAAVSYSKGSNAPDSTFTFNNTYATTPTNPISISALKKVEGLSGNVYTMSADEFKFQIEPSHQNPEQDPIDKAIKANLADGTVALFENVVYTQPGTYHYTVHELDGTIGGISYDDSIYEIEVVVSDNTAIAQLEAGVTITKSVDGSAPVVVSEIVFNNQYRPDVASALIYGHKNLLGGHKELAEGEFQFKLEAVSGIEYDALGKEQPAAVIPMPADRGDLVTNLDTGLFQFGRITYERPGIYTYKVTEVAGHQFGYSYSNASYTVTVTVSDENGALVATVSDLNQVVFDNYYVPEPVQVTVDGAKVLTGRAPNEGEFVFELLDADGNVIRETANEGSTFAFDAIEYTKAGVYHYTLVERATHVDGVTYDDTVYGVKVTVTDPNYQGELKATVEYLHEGQIVETATFNNAYKAAPTSIKLGAVKTMIGRPLSEKEFYFVLVDENGKEDIVANKADGSVEFAEIRFETAGTYVYTISEQIPADDQKEAAITYDERVYTVTVTVEDMLNGHLRVTKVDYAVANGVFEDAEKPAVVFANTYTPEAVSIGISGMKELIGRDLFNDEFEFALINMDGQEVVAKNQGKTFAFENITFDKVGDYYFKIVEKDTKLPGVTYNPENVIYDVKVEVTDVGYTGKLAAKVTYMKNGEVVDAADVVFTNIYNTASVSIEVDAIKKLTGRVLSAGEFKFVLEDEQGNKFYAVNAADGSIHFETITFTEDGTYIYKLYEEKGNLENVTYDDTVYTIKVTVKDDLKGNLIAEAECDAKELVFNNVYEEPVVKEPEDNVDSGDHSNIGGYTAASLVSMMALIVLLIFKRRSTN